MSITHLDVTRATEQTGYVEVAHDHVYAVLHQARSPRARVLLLGPFAPERSQAYLPLVRWSRYLAARDMEVLRFDYRGVGESTGAFEQMSFADWLGDGRSLSQWLGARVPGIPLYLHGLGLGAIIAGKLFDEGVGDALLLWDAPPDANVILRSALSSWVTLQKLGRRAENRKPLAHYVKQLDDDGMIEVDGYVWSSKLWHDSFDFRLPALLRDEEAATLASRKPVKNVVLGRKGAALTRGGLSGYDAAGDFEWLYSASLEWMTTVLTVTRKVTS